LFSLKAQVEEAEKGGEQPMNDFENQEFENQVENTNPQNENTFQENSESEVSEPVNEGTVPENNEEEPVSEPETEANDFSALQEQFSQLQNSYDELQSNYAAAQSRITELEEFQANANSEIEGLRSTNEQLQTSIQNYEAKIVVIENTKKENLIEKYAKVLSAEEINEVKEKINDFSYEELESKLAITFANSKITGEEIKKVPLPEPVESQFALLMKNYRKN
jgi:chromosome segregation ATPase